MLITAGNLAPLSIFRPAIIISRRRFYRYQLFKIMGAGHGFVSSSIRFNTPAVEWAYLHDVWPGGSRILVDICVHPGDEEHAGAAFT